jgi:ribosome maturation protein Sdo1
MAQPHKLFYKGNENDFIVYVEDIELLTKFRKGDTTIPLIDLVSIYKIFVSRLGGSEGVFDEASKAELSNEFGKKDKDEIIKVILKEGSDKHGAGIKNGNESRNDSMGGGFTGN